MRCTAPRYRFTLRNRGSWKMSHQDPAVRADRLARPSRRPSRYPAVDPVRHFPGLAIGPAAPSAGGAPASEAAAHEVEAAWNREDFTPISRSALKVTHKPLCCSGSGLRIAALQGRMSLVRNRHRACLNRQRLSQLWQSFSASGWREGEGRRSVKKCPKNLCISPGFPLPHRRARGPVCLHAQRKPAVRLRAPRPN